jgi:hypothetical protein
MGRLDAVLGRSPLDAPEPEPAEPIQTVLWLDEDPEARAASPSGSDKGPDKVQTDLAGQARGPFGTAYRIPGEMSHVSQPRSRSASKRRMRQDR